MSSLRILGFVLIVVGFVALLSGGVFWTRNKTVIDAGPVQVKTQKHEGFAVPPILGVGALVAGIALLVIPSRRRA